jgi:hypothetical protein
MREEKGIEVMERRVCHYITKMGFKWVNPIKNVGHHQEPCCSTLNQILHGQGGTSDMGGVAKVTPEMWKKCVLHTERIEREMFLDDVADTSNRPLRVPTALPSLLYCPHLGLHHFFLLFLLLLHGSPAIPLLLFGTALWLPNCANSNLMLARVITAVGSDNLHDKEEGKEVETEVEESEASPRHAGALKSGVPRDLHCFLAEDEVEEEEELEVLLGGRGAKPGCEKRDSRSRCMISSSWSLRNLVRKVSSKLERVDRWVSVLMGVEDRQMKLE